MKDSIITPSKTRFLMATLMLSASTLTFSANFDLLNQPQTNFGGIEQNAPLKGETWNTPSILESMQQEKIKEKKKDYLEILNLFKQNKLNEGEKKLAALFKQYPEDPELFNLQALADSLKKDIASAEKNYQKAIAKDKNNILAHLGLSKLALDGGDLTKAQDYANKTLTINPKIVNAHLLLADVAYKQKNTSQVESILSNALKQVAGNIAQEIEVIQNLGKFYAIQKQPEKILALGEDLSKRYPGDNQALSLLAGAQIVNNKKAEAEQTLVEIIKHDKQDVNHRLLLAKLLSDSTEKEKEVIKLLDEALTIAPENPQVLVFKTAYQIKLKHYPEALELANLAEKKFPAGSIGALLKGDVYLAEKKPDEALKNYQQAYKKQPNDKVLFTIADLLVAQKKTPEAMKLLENELAKNSKNNAVHFKLASLYQQQNDYQQAEKHYNAMLADQPDNALALNNLAWIYSQQNNPKAAELAEKAFSKAPESAAIADTYGFILLKQEPAKGLEILEKAAALAPQANDIQYHLAAAYNANDQKTKAIEILERILKSENYFAEKNAAAELLKQLKQD